MGRMRYVMVALMAVGLAACASDKDATSTDGVTQPTTSASPATTVEESTTTAGPTTTSAPAELAEPEARRFEIDGAVVWARTASDRLPERATVVRFTEMLIDSGDGLELCLSGVDDSLPPQCGGPVVDGLDPAGWTETLGGVTWGTRSVTVEWPAVDGRLTLLSDEPALPFERLGDERPEGLPADCEAITTPVDQETIGAFAAENPDRVAITRAVNLGTEVVLQVPVEHLEAVRTELSVGGAEPCLEAVEHSRAELTAAQDRLFAAGLYSEEGPVLGSGSGNSLNRLDVTLSVADRATIDMVIDAVDEPGILHITSYSEILEGQQ